MLAATHANYLTDKQRVELSLAPAVVRLFFAGGVRESNRNDFYKQVDDLLYEALQAPIDDLLPDHARKIARRVIRVTDDLAREYNNQDGFKLLLTAMLWLQDILEQDKLSLHWDSPFSKAADMLIADLSEDVKHWSMVEKSAHKQARKLGEMINRHGYLL